MKTTLLAVLTSIAVLSFAVPAFSNEVNWPRPQLVTVMPEKLFVPPGFDENDNSQVVITGTLPNTCFKSGPVTSKVDHQKKTITIKNEAYYNKSSWCLFVLVPFTQTVNLGTLDAGSYRVLFEGNATPPTVSGTMSIASNSNPSTDDHIYALVEESRLLPASNPQSDRTLLISGSLTSSCMYIKSVQVMKRSENVIEVLPIVEVPRDVVCEPMLRPFETEVKLEGPLKGDLLVHTRSLNGQSLNRVFKF